jgi:proteasome lid subunit RPN8/RPN11
LLLGQGRTIDRVQPAANVAADPLRHFEIDPAALIAAYRAARGDGPQVLGYYHSHPAGHPLPSVIDCEHASGDGRTWAIVSGGEVTFWRDEKNGFEPLSTRVVAG